MRWKDENDRERLLHDLCDTIIEYLGKLLQSFESGFLPAEARRMISSVINEINDYLRQIESLFVKRGGRRTTGEERAIKVNKALHDWKVTLLHHRKYEQVEEKLKFLPEPKFWLGMFTDSDELASFTLLYASQQEKEKVLRALNQTPGVKLESSELLKGQRITADLGYLPTHRQTDEFTGMTTLPGCVKKMIYGCVRVDLDRHRTDENGKRLKRTSGKEEGETSTGNISMDQDAPEQEPQKGTQRTRKTHIWKTDDKKMRCCPFRFTIREFTNGYYGFTFCCSNVYHNCPDTDSFRVPLRSHDLVWLLGQLSQDDAETVYRKGIIPLQTKAREEGRPFSRVETLTEADLRRLAEKFSIVTKHKPGEDDFKNAKLILEEIRMQEGGRIACKFPGVDPKNVSRDLLDPEAVTFLEHKDLFLFLMTDVQKGLLERYGHCIASDGTHCTLTYNCVKLIVVLCTSSNEPSVDERGFPCCILFTLSEREEIHKALIVHLKNTLSASFQPKLLMTDMTFSAFHAWSAYYSSIKLLWCRFHVYQGWVVKKLSRSRWKRPEGISEEEFIAIRGPVVREVMELITTDMDWDTFNQRAQRFSDLLWAIDPQYAKIWDQTYLKNKHLWAPPARSDVARELFGSSELHCSKLVNSNNSLERFFGVLKHGLLGGKCASTFSSFLEIWKLYHHRLLINLTKAGIDYRTLGSPLSETDCDRLFDQFEFEDLEETREEEAEMDNDNEKDGDGEEAREEQPEIEDDNEKDGDRGFSQNAGLDAAPLQSICTLRERSFKELETLHKELGEKLTSLRNSNLDYPRIAILKNALLKSTQVFDALVEREPDGPGIDDSQLHHTGIAPFRHQRGNYGDDETTDVDAKALYKQSNRKTEKRARKDADHASKPRSSFYEVSRTYLEDQAVQTRIALAREMHKAEYLPLLRTVLAENTKSRIILVVKNLLSIQLPKTVGKSQLVERSIGAIISLAGLLPSMFQRLKEVADFGIEKDSGRLVLLVANGLNNAYNPRVNALEFLQGFVISDGSIELKEYPIRSIRYGMLANGLRDGQVEVDPERPL